LSSRPRLQDQAGEAERAHRLQVDALEGARQIVAAIAGAELAEGVGMGHRRLAPVAKPLHGVAQLLQLGKARALAVEAHQQARDPLVRARLIERQDHVGKRRLPADRQRRQRIAAGDLLETLAQVQGQHHALRQARPARQHEPGEGGDADHRQQRERADHRQDPDQDAPQHAPQPAHLRRPPGCAAGARWRS
jgi:hypothetical protein